MSTGSTRPVRRLKVRVVAERLDVHTRTVKRYIAQGLLVAERLPSKTGRGHLRIDERELARFMLEQGWVR